MPKNKDEKKVNLLEINGLSSIVRNVESSGNGKKEHPDKKVSSGKQEGTPAAISVEKVKDSPLWDEFIRNVDYYRENRGKETGIWIDEDIKQSLEKLKMGPIKAPVKILANAILRAFIIANADNCKKNSETTNGLF